jgi:uncharacterized tellurite resistance protein B-like protein
MAHSDSPEPLSTPAVTPADKGESPDFGRMELSPPLILTAAIMYMMSADGEVEESEISRLQSVLGGHQELLACALSYTQSVPIDTFLAEAAAALNTMDKLCILINVCDSFLADGVADEAELALFARISESFGISLSVFEPFLKTIQIKNNKAPLGPYAADLASTPQGGISHHLALAAGMLYMMAADGTITAEEIGCLQAAIGSYDGLKSLAVKYISKVKSAQFLKDIAPRLPADVQTLILINACDTMLADGVVAPAEKTLFLNMLAVFGYTEKSFAPHYKALHIKNVRSFDLNDFATSPAARLFRSAQYQKSQSEFMATRAVSSTKEKRGIVIQRAMQKNLDEMGEPVEGFLTPNKVQVKARGSVQTRQADQPDENINFIEDGKSQRDNVQFVDEGRALSENVQFVDEGRSLSENIQIVDDGKKLSKNMQFVDDSKSPSKNMQFMEDDKALSKNKAFDDEDPSSRKNRPLADSGTDPSQSKKSGGAAAGSDSKGQRANPGGDADADNSTAKVKSAGDLSAQKRTLSGTDLDAADEDSLRSGESAIFATDSSTDTSGLTAMAQGEMSFRERAMQMGRGSAWSGASQGSRRPGSRSKDADEIKAMDPPVVRAELKKLKLRNEDVEVEVNKLYTATDPLSLMGSGENRVDSADAATENEMQENQQVSVLQRVSQAFMQGGNLLNKPRPGQGSNSDSAPS